MKEKYFPKNKNHKSLCNLAKQYSGISIFRFQLAITAALIRAIMVRASPGNTVIPVSVLWGSMELIVNMVKIQF